MKQKGKLYHLAILLLLALMLSSCGNQGEKAKKIIERTLYEKYGEEFEVYNLGIRNANGDKFYQARIYPKSIIGTSKENDSYYRAEAVLNIEPFGGLAKYAGDTYEEIMMNDEAEEFLLPKAKELFGEFIRIKADIHFERKAGDGYSRQFVSGFQEKREIVKNAPENYRMVVNLHVYIFDRIDDEAEKEKRREESYQFLEYLKYEKLFEYLEMGVIFVDEIVLTPSYTKYRKKINNIEKIKEKINGKEIYLPIKEFRIQMLETLTKENLDIYGELKISNINNILKSNLEIYNGSEYFRGSSKDSFWAESLNYLREVNQFGGYQKAVRNKTLKKHNYKSKDDLEYFVFNHYLFRGGE